MGLALVATSVLLLQAAQLLLQTAPPGAAQQSVKASIEGAVVRLGSGDPIPGVELSVRKVSTQPEIPNSDDPLPQNLRPDAPLATTDRQGKFVIKDLAPGLYRLVAARNGYVKQEYGQRAFRGQGTVINLTQRPTAKDLVIQLTPAGTITGIVRDDMGDPLTGVEVQILEAAYSDLGKRSLRPVSSARTDDRGEYRLYWVTPSRYYARVKSAGRLDPPWTSKSPNEVLPKPYPTTYYPGVNNASDAK